MKIVFAFQNIIITVYFFVCVTNHRKLLDWTRSNFIIKSELSESEFIRLYYLISEMVIMSGNFFKFYSNFKEYCFVFQENWSKLCLAIGMSSLASLVLSRILGEIATFSLGHVTQPFCSGTGMGKAVGLEITQAVSTFYFITFTSEM